MVKVLKYFFILNLLLWNLPGFLAGQDEGTDVDRLRQERERYLNEINYTEKLLDSTTSSKTDQLSKIRLLRGKINSRENVIALINREITYLEGVIINRQNDIASLRKELDQLKHDYARMVQKAYQTRKSYDKAQYILAANDFNQAYKRIRYMQQYNKFRREQAEQIRTRQEMLELQIKELSADQEQKSELLIRQKNEVARMHNERKEKDRVLQNLTNAQKQLQAQLNEKKAAMKKVEEEITRLIAESMGEDRDGGMQLTPEMKIISADFGNNQGRLPWPVERGVVVSRFGKHKHEVLTRVDVDNKGIDIATSSGSSVRSVFSGKVSNVISIKGANLTVIIQHGEYFTVYQNLVSLQVKKGDHVQTRQAIGKVYADPKGGNSEMHFQLWKGNKIQNPELWLAK